MNASPFRRPAPRPPEPEVYDETDDLMRMLKSSSRRTAMTEMSKAVGLIILCLLGVLIFALFIDHIYQQGEDCRRKGGTMIDDRCLEVREIK